MIFEMRPFAIQCTYNNIFATKELYFGRESPHLILLLCGHDGRNTVLRVATCHFHGPMGLPACPIVR